MITFGKILRIPAVVIAALISAGAVGGCGGRVQDRQRRARPCDL